MKEPYHIVTRAARESAVVIEQFCQANGQILLPIVNLIQNASQVVETVIYEIGHQTLQQILLLSAEQLAGPRTPGKSSGQIRHHGSQPGRVQLADRKVKVKRPRLRHKSEGEVKVPAYEMLRQDRGLGQHMLGALLRGVSTREYQEVLPQMAETVGVSRSAISRKVIEASIEQLQQLQERRWDSQGYEGVGFAMPANVVAKVYNALIGPDHRVVRGSIGVEFAAEPNPSVARIYGVKSGVTIANVVSGSPADQAGLKVGDTITSVDGKPTRYRLIQDIGTAFPMWTVLHGL